MTDDHMIDNAATASQHLPLLDDLVVREAIQLNIIAPLRAEIERLRDERDAAFADGCRVGLEDAIAVCDSQAREHVRLRLENNDYHKICSDAIEACICLIRAASEGIPDPDAAVTKWNTGEDGW